MRNVYVIFLLLLCGGTLRAAVVKDWKFDRDFAPNGPGHVENNSDVVLGKQFTILIWSRKVSHSPRESVLFSQRIGGITFEVRDAYEAVRLLMYPRMLDVRLKRDTLSHKLLHATAVVCDGKTVKIYVDGKLYLTRAYSHKTPVKPGNAKNCIGISAFAPNSAFPGSIPRVLIFDEPLTQERILSVMHETCPN